MADTDFDFSLLDASPAPETEPTLVESVDADTSTVATPMDEPVAATTPVEAPPLPAGTDDFDYSAPLTPREKILMERLEKITGDHLDAPVELPAVAPVVPSEKNFLEGFGDLDNVFSSAENFNKLLLSVHNNALEEATKLTAERILSNLPQIMSQYVTQHISMNRLVDDFYTANADLVPVKRTVTAVASEIAAEHPEYTTQQVFDETAKKTREILRIQQAPMPAAAKPAFVPPRGSRSRIVAPVLSEIEKGVLDLIT